MVDALKAYRTRCAAFFKPLWPGEEKVLVFGEGRAERPLLMLIGEAPGEQEVMEGRPFAGKAGKNLTAFLAGIGLDREDIYITNAVKIRPVKVSDKGRVSNRPPSREEIGLFLPFLREEIFLVNPRMLVTLGNVALQALKGKGTVGEAHGHLTAAAILTEQGKEREFPLFPLYHPASVIYSPALGQVYQEDLAALKKLLPEGAGA